MEIRNVQVDVKLTTSKPTHAGWIMGFCKRIPSAGSLVKSGFRKSLITETAKEMGTAQKNEVFH